MSAYLMGLLNGNRFPKQFTFFKVVNSLSALSAGKLNFPMKIKQLNGRNLEIRVENNKDLHNNFLMSCLKSKAVTSCTQQADTNDNKEQNVLMLEQIENPFKSFQNSRRVLVKFGKFMSIQIQRFYTLHNDILMYFNTAISQKPKSSINLSGCFITKDKSKLKIMSASLKITTQSKKTFWLHPICDDELPILEKYLRSINDGIFNQDKIIKQVYNSELENTNTQYQTKHDKQRGISAYSSNVQITGIPSSTLNPLASNTDNKVSNLDGILPLNSNQLNSFLTTDQQFEAVLGQATAKRSSEQKLSYNSQMKELEPISEITRSNLQVRNDHQSIQHHKIGGSEMNWPEKHELKEKRQSLACSCGKRGCTNDFSNNNCMRVNVLEENLVGKNPKIFLDTCDKTSIKTGLKQGENNQIDNIKVVFDNPNCCSQDNTPNPTNKIDWSLGKCQNQSLEKSLSPRKKNQSQQLTPGEYIITLGQISQDNNIFAIQESSQKDNQEKNNQFVGFDLHKYVLNNETPGGMSPHTSREIGLNEDLDLSSDEECQQLKNQKLEAVRLNFYGTFSQQVHAHREYFSQANNNTNTSVTQNHQSLGNLSFQNNNSHQNDHKSYLDFDEQLLGQQDVIPNKYGGGTCNLSSGTLQKWCLAEGNNKNLQQQQQQQVLQQQTDSPQGSLFSNPFFCTPNQAIPSQALPAPHGSNRSPFSSTFQTSLNTGRPQILKQSSELTKSYDEEEGNISMNEITHEAQSQNFSIKHQVFCARGSKNFLQEDAEELINHFSKKVHSSSHQRNSRIGVITDYSFDKKTISETDLFEQEEGNFQRTVYDTSDLKHQANHQKSTACPEEEQVLYQQVLASPVENTNSLEGDQENPKGANNITQIILKYQEQNYHMSHAHSQHLHEYQSLTQHPSFQVQPTVNEQFESQNQPKILRNRVKRCLSIDAEQCNWQYENDYNTSSHKQVPQIKDKKEFYNKKNVTPYLMPKMEEVLPFLSKELSEAKCFTEGYYYLWSFQFNNARELFQLHRETNVLFELALLEENLLRIIVSGSKQLIVETEDKFAKLLEYILACQKDIAKKGSQSKIKCLLTISPVGLDLLKAEIHIIRGLLQSLLNNKFQAFLSFKNAYSKFSKVKLKLNLKDTQNEAQLLQNLDVQFLCRFYFLQGIFNIGLSMIPSTFLKILSLIGVSPNKQLGYESLEKCAQLDSIRSSYASLLLAIEYTELNPNLDKSIPIIKKMIKQLPQCPLFYWLAALLSWRYAKPDDALNLINKSLWNCGENISKVSYYLKFEKGWFSVSQLDWKSALKLFEEIAMVALDIEKLDFEVLSEIAISKKITHKTVDLIRPLAQTAKNNVSEGQKMILPHKCCVAALIACCYETMGLTDYMNLWLLMPLYINKKSSESKTQVDDEIAKLCSKYLTRANRQFIKYEMLYFVKEITKLREDMLGKMVIEIEDYFLSQFSHIEFQEYPKLLQKASLTAIDFSSTIFLRIVGGCLQQDFKTVYEAGEILDKIAEFVPSDHSYILHHSYHWLGRCYSQQQLLTPARDKLRKCLKYRKSEFSLENKTAKLLQEIDSLQAIG